MDPAISGRSRPLIRSAKIEKIAKNHEKSDFSKIHNFLYSGRKYDIWLEIGLLGPGKHSETLYWPSHAIWRHLTKSQKNRIFDPQNRDKKFFKVDFFCRWGPATKSRLGIDTSYRCPQGPVILLYWPHPFLPQSSFENSKKIQKIIFFCESDVFVAFVAFSVLLMLFFKISKTWRYC